MKTKPTMLSPKAEAQDLNPIRNRNAGAGRLRYRQDWAPKARTEVRASEFGTPSALGIRPSDFRNLLFLLATVALFVLGSGCTDRPSPSPVVAEGVLHSVSYQLGDGRVGGFTRLPLAQAVPGGNGSWNVDAYGRLTRDFLFVTYPDERDLSNHAIPVHCLLHVKFGDAGRPTINRTEPHPAQP